MTLLHRFSATAIACWVLAGCEDNSRPGGCGECAAPNFCSAGECVALGEPALATQLGNRLGELQVEDPEEAAPEAPNSIAPNADGSRVWVLDQLNKRLQLFIAGEVDTELPLGSPLWDDVTLLDNGDLLLFSRNQNLFQVFSPQGKQISEAQVTGVGLEQAGYVEGVFVRPDGVWVQAGHLSILVLDPEGHAIARRRVLTGMPSRDGERLISTEILSDGSVHVNSRGARGKAHYLNAHLRFTPPALSLYVTDTDRKGRIYIVSQHPALGDTPGRDLLTVLNADLSQRSQQELKQDFSGRDVFRPVAVSANGDLFKLESDDVGVKVRRY